MLRGFLRRSFRLDAPNRFYRLTRSGETLRPVSAPEGAPHLPKPTAPCDRNRNPKIAIRQSQRSPCGDQQPDPAQRAETGRRPQRPGNQHALTRMSGIPPAISPSRKIAGCRWLCHKSSGRLKNSHVSLNPLSVRLFRAAIGKTSALVNNLWTLCLPCGNLRKTSQENFFSSTYKKIENTVSNQDTHHKAFIVKTHSPNNSRILFAR